MTLLQIIVLALIQGLTEFLPISSSAHLILGSELFGWPDQGLVFDVATHLGTLLAVFVYFRHDLMEMGHAWLGPAVSESERRHRAMSVCLALASIPVLVIGFLARDIVGDDLRHVRVIAWSTIGFGLLLWFADLKSNRSRVLEELKLRDALWVGFAQALALIPGASRSGVTIMMGRFLGFTPDAAARFSFLLAIPVVAAAGAYGLWRVASGGTRIEWAEFLLAMGFSAVAGWVCIAAFLALLRRVGLLPFILYRFALGVVLFWLTA